MRRKHAELIVRRRISEDEFLQELRDSERQIYDWQQSRPAHERSALLNTYFRWFPSFESGNFSEHRKRSQKVVVNRRDTLRAGPMALPENSPPKSMRFRTLFRFCPSTCNRMSIRSDL